MIQKDFFEEVKKIAEEYGLSEKENAVVRRYLLSERSEKTDSKAYYFGFVNEDEATSGIYQNFSLVIFQGKDADVKQFVIGLVAGSNGFTTDRELASRPGVRRKFLKLRTDSNNDKIFFKTRFDDVVTSSKELVKLTKNTPLKEGIEKYKTVLSAAELVDFRDEEIAFSTIRKWVAVYAELRQWGTQDEHAKERRKILKDLEDVYEDEKEIKEIKNLLKAHRFIVLQGAPGVGKTYNALKIAASDFEDDNVIFEQFHAETSYSDFVWGLHPKADGNGFEGRPGVLLRAIDRANAVKDDDKKVLLIIDEINRANLANVLGPVFFLFEKKAGDRKNISLEIGGKKYDKIPDNLYVIATMNTADRSLAVVDYALRRRFVWYTLKPHPFKSKDFKKDIYSEFSEIFEMHATDEELNLQPGPSYFLAANKDEMKERLTYELMPLIKEYLVEGNLLSARDEFSNFFLKHTGRYLFE